jgi:hypothetical protein
VNEPRKLVFAVMMTNPLMNDPGWRSRVSPRRCRRWHEYRLAAGLKSLFAESAVGSEPLTS